MAIRHRRGDYGNFEPSKLVSGEFAYVNSGDPNTDDGKGVYASFTGGRVKRLCTYDEVSGLIEEARGIKDDVEDIKEDVEVMSEDAETYSKLSQSYAVGTNNEVRENDASDNSKYYKEWVENALDRTIPQFVVDFETGNLMYLGGVFTFNIDSQGHLNWYM